MVRLMGRLFRRRNRRNQDWERPPEVRIWCRGCGKSLGLYHFGGGVAAAPGGGPTLEPERWVIEPHLWPVQQGRGYEFSINPGEVPRPGPIPGPERYEWACSCGRTASTTSTAIALYLEGTPSRDLRL